MGAAEMWTTCSLKGAETHSSLPVRSTPPGVAGGGGGEGGPQCGDRCMRPSAQGGFINRGVFYSLHFKKMEVNSEGETLGGNGDIFI